MRPRNKLLLFGCGLAAGYLAYRRRWSIAHNWIAHPLIVVAEGARWQQRFHDWTEKRWDLSTRKIRYVVRDDQPFHPHLCRCERIGVMATNQSREELERYGTVIEDENGAWEFEGLGVALALADKAKAETGCDHSVRTDPGDAYRLKRELTRHIDAYFHQVRAGPGVRHRKDDTR